MFLQKLKISLWQYAPPKTTCIFLKLGICRIASTAFWVKFKESAPPKQTNALSIVWMVLFCFASFKNSGLNKAYLVPNANLVYRSLLKWFSWACGE